MFFADNARQPFDGFPRRDCGNESDAGPLAITCYRVIDTEVAEKRFRGNSERRTARDYLRIWRGLAKCLQHYARLRRVVAERDRVAVIDIANRNADDVWTKSPRNVARATDRIPRKAKIEEAYIVSGCVERRRDTCQTIGNDGIWLALTIGADKQHPGAIGSCNLKS
jgi:hypothetical protein